MLEQLKKAQGKGKAIQKSSGQEEEEEKVGTRIRLGLKPWGELKIHHKSQIEHNKSSCVSGNTMRTSYFKTKNKIAAHDVTNFE